MADKAVTLETLSAQFSALDLKLTNHINEEMGMLSAAFPGGDAEGHRRAHEAMIAATNAQRKFWDELRLDLMKKGVWSVIIVVLGLLAMGIATKFGLPPIKP